MKSFTSPILTTPEKLAIGLQECGCLLTRASLYRRALYRTEQDQQTVLYITFEDALVRSA